MDYLATILMKKGLKQCAVSITHHIRIKIVNISKIKVDRQHCLEMNKNGYNKYYMGVCDGYS